MKAKIIARPFLALAFVAVVALLCIDSISEAANPGHDAPTATNENVKVDFDFTRMNPTMRMTYTYRLGANPKEFVGKTLRISGTLLTRVDKENGKRYFGCLMGDPGGCSCCSPGGVLEFMPKDSYTWPTNFPPLESRVMITGRLEMFEVGPPEQAFTIPRLVDADIFKPR